jgi:hypothetical protein
MKEIIQETTIEQDFSLDGDRHLIRKTIKESTQGNGLWDALFALSAFSTLGLLIVISWVLTISWALDITHPDSKMTIQQVQAK